MAIEAYEGGRLAEARRLFARAHELAPSARTLRGLGVASFALGDYLEAETMLAASLVHPVLPLTDELRALVEALLVQARTRLGELRFVQPYPGDVVLVDGVPVHPRDGTWYVAPGAHHVAVRREGVAILERDVDVVAGEAEVLTLGEREQPREERAPTTMPLPEIAPAVARPARLPLLLGGSAVLAIGAALYGTAVARHGRVERACEHVCSQDEIDARFRSGRIEPLGRAGVTLAAAGLASAVAGGVLFGVGARRARGEDLVVITPRSVTFLRTF